MKGGDFSTLEIITFLSYLHFSFPDFSEIGIYHKLLIYGDGNLSPFVFGAPHVRISVLSLFTSHARFYRVPCPSPWPPQRHVPPASSSPHWPSLALSSLAVTEERGAGRKTLHKCVPVCPCVCVLTREHSLKRTAVPLSLHDTVMKY